MDVDRRLALRIRALRADHGMTLEALAAASGVSRSMISLIERGGTSPTATVLAKLAAALQVTLPALFEDGAAEAAGPLARRADQGTWRDPATGYVRRMLSPPLPAPFQLVEVVFPPGQRVTLDNPSVGAVHQQVWLLEGALQLALGDETWQLGPGDCLAMSLDRPTVFHNPGRKPARYLVAVATHPDPRRNR